MDAVAGLLDGPRARGAFVLRVTLDPPWSLRVESRAPLAIFVMLRGEAWIVDDEAGERAVTPGEVAIVSGRDPYIVCDHPSTDPQVVIHPGERCATVDGEDLAEVMGLGVRMWGTSLDAATSMIVGTYQMDGEVGRGLIEAMPRVMVVPADRATAPIVSLLESETTRESLGQGAVLDRLVDLLLVSTVRAWFTRPEAEPPSWYVAQADPVVGPALRMIFNNPSYPWTVSELARGVGASRASLAKRFQDLVGESPISFLTNWRLDLAADLILESGLTLAAVASRVGYSTPFALSNAFKRAYGVSPTAYRAKKRVRDEVVGDLYQRVRNTSAGQ